MATLEWTSQASTAAMITCQHGLAGELLEDLDQDDVLAQRTGQLHDQPQRQDHQAEADPDAPDIARHGRRGRA